MGYEWNFGVVWDSLPFMLQGLRFTVALAVLSMAGALVFGLLLSLARLSNWRLLRWPATAYIEFMRGTPLLVQLLWVYYSLPILTGITPSPFMAGLIGLTLNLTAFIAEIYRAGIVSIGRGQREAALSLGMNQLQSMYRIILPQAVRRVVPPLGSMWVSLFKDTALVSIIAVADLMYQAKVLSIQTYRPIEIFTAVAVIYFVITYPQARSVDWLYDRFRVRA
jgi:His/Glu/Gln/Arg/opine family amino acid ABC transporter permease subunit